MLCLTVVRVTGVPTQVDTLRQAGRNTIGTTTPQTANLNSRVTGVPTQVDAHRQAEPELHIGTTTPRIHNQVCITMSSRTLTLHRALYIHTRIMHGEE
jgi:hypothetical protein